MSAPTLTICACHPRDGLEVELINFDPNRTAQVCTDLRTGLTEIIPTNALIITRGAA